MDIQYRNHRFFNILTISLPLFCFLLSWSATTSSSTSPPSLSSPLSAAEILRSRGYTLFASTIISSLNLNLNLSGTIFAPPDFAFSFHRIKPTKSLLLFHSLPPPQLHFLALVENSPKFLPTRNRNLCLFFSKTRASEIAISTSSKPRSSVPVKIRQPDLYVDDQLTIHGIDGILDPSAADLCPTDPPRSDHKQNQNHNQNHDSYDDYEPFPSKKRKSKPRIHPQGANSGYLDHAIRVLKRRGFNFVATALAIRRSRLLTLTSVTVFAPSDRSIFVENANGFRYDFLHHVVPLRLRYDSLSRQAVGFTAFETLAANKSVIVEVDDGVVRVDGVRVDGTEIYFNRWIVVFAVPMSLDDAVEGLLNPHSLPSSPPPPETPESDETSGSCDGGGGGATDTAEAPREEPEPMCPPMAPLPGVDIGEVFDGAGNSNSTPLPGVDIGEVFDGVRYSNSSNSGSDLNSNSNSTPGIEIAESPTEVESIPESSGGEVPRCLGEGIEDEDLLCQQHTTVRKLQEADVEECDPSDGPCQLKAKVVAESRSLISKTEVNIADDLFFYA